MFFPSVPTEGLKFSEIHFFFCALKVITTLKLHQKTKRPISFAKNKKSFFKDGLQPSIFFFVNLREKKFYEIFLRELL